MATTEVFHGVSGILRPFREYITGLNLSEGDQIVYYGCVGTCTPFVELLAIALRGNKATQVFVPLLDEAKAKKIGYVENIGMQVCGGSVPVNPKVIVIMGGLAMPLMPLTKDDVNAMIRRHEHVKVVGVCFMSMFKKAGWLDTLSFDCLIDAQLNPVEVTK
jgi:hypothetical protein